jgi:hypothetical protein
MSNESQVLSITTDGPAGKRVTGTVSLVNAAGSSIFQSGKLNLDGADTWMYFTAGAPVDYTDGSPPATGEAEAGIGSLCVRLDTGKWYTNKGTKAQPIWGIITSA